MLHYSVLRNKANSYRASAFVRTDEGQELQKKLWDETMEMLRKHVEPGLLEVH